MTLYSGNPFDGIQCGEDKIIVTANLQRLKNAGLGNPLEVDKATQKTRNRDATIGAAYDLRVKIQRRFDPARQRRAKDYAEYIDMCARGLIQGDTPPINLWSSKPGVFENGTFFTPYDTPLVAIDGETQTLARFNLAENSPETAVTLEFPVIFHNGISVEAAEQRLHDYNRYAHPVDEKKLASANRAGPLTKVAEAAIGAAGWDLKDIRTDGDLPRKNRKEHASFLQIQAGAIGVVEGGLALNRPLGTSIKLLNDPRATVKNNGVTAAFVQQMASLPSPGALPPQLWLVLGAIAHDRTSVAITEGLVAQVYRAWESTKTTGRGGPRVPMKQRLLTAYQTV